MAVGDGWQKSEIKGGKDSQNFYASLMKNIHPCTHTHKKTTYLSFLAFCPFIADRADPSPVTLTSARRQIQMYVSGESIWAGERRQSSP